MNKFDFSGYATKNNIKCTDGRIIRKDAFIENDGARVPLVWQHAHSEPSNVLGHAVLENRADGVYAYCTLNNTPGGQNAKLLIQHGDITALSIYANQLVQKGADVIHGMIREVSLVLAGANPGARIDNVIIEHSDGTETTIDDEAIIYNDSSIVFSSKELVHADNEEDEETIGDIFNTLNEKQKTVVFALIAQVLEDKEENDEVKQSDEGADNIIMKHNVFENDNSVKNRPTLTHAQFQEIVADAQKVGSFKEAFLAHVQTYGIENIDYLFPDAQAVTGKPAIYQRDNGWVASVINGTYHTPFARIKTTYADITADAARALGYVKNNLKKDEVIKLLRRITNPTTIYKKQKLDRDDIIDITDLDVVAWLKSEMRMMLDEELARAILVGDGRAVESADKINEENIRPIWTDDDMYAHKVEVAAAADYEDMIDEVIKARKNYKGSGDPVFYTTPDVLSGMLLIKDTTGRRIYASVNELASALRVSKIVEVPVMEGLSRVDGVKTLNLLGIIVNLKDYAVGADKGGAIGMFDDFDIDYNQYKYLMETRCSGALTLPKAALVVEQLAA